MVDLVESVEMPEKEVHQSGLEMAAPLRPDQLDGLIPAPGCLIDPVLADGVEDIGQAGDPAEDVDALARQSPGVAAPVPPFVVLMGHDGRRPDNLPAGGLEDLVAAGSGPRPVSARCRPEPRPGSRPDSRRRPG